MADTLLFPYANKLLTCLCDAALANSSDLYPAPGICCLRAGESVALDITDAQVDECCLGLAYVRIDNFYPTGSAGAGFPSPSSDFALNACAPYAWGLQMEMAIWRCLVTPTTCDNWNYAAQRQLLDAKTMREALCCFMSQLDPQSVSVTPWQAKGPEGGCLGGTMNVTVMVENCEGCT